MANVWGRCAGSYLQSLKIDNFYYRLCLLQQQFNLICAVELAGNWPVFTLFYHLFTNKDYFHGIIH